MRDLPTSSHSRWDWQLVNELEPQMVTVDLISILAYTLFVNYFVSPSQRSQVMSPTRKAIPWYE